MSQIYVDQLLDNNYYNYTPAGQIPLQSIRNTFFLSYPRDCLFHQHG